MRKILVLVVFGVLLLPGNAAFAQFGKNIVKAGINARNLERFLTTAGKRSTIGRSVVRVPKHIAPGGAVALTVRSIPSEITPANASFVSVVQKLNEILPLTGKVLEERVGWVANAWGDIGPHGQPSKGKGFYEDQTALAKDLDNFYRGQSEVMIGPDGREVKLYTLPVDGILYQPVGYITPLVLLSDEYFVIYDVESQTGKLAENTPEVYGMFKKRPLPAVATPKQVPANVMPQQRYLANYAHFANPEVRAMNQLKWGNRSLKTEVSEPTEFGRTLVSFNQWLPAKVKHLQTGEISFVYEIPVDGLIYKTYDSDAFPLNSKTTVLIYNEQKNSGYFLDREILENPQFYEFVAP